MLLKQSNKSPKKKVLNLVMNKSVVQPYTYKALEAVLTELLGENTIKYSNMSMPQMVDSAAVKLFYTNEVDTERANFIRNVMTDFQINGYCRNMFQPNGIKGC